MNSIQLKIPATIANLSCGFDILGLCVNSPFDRLEVKKIKEKLVKIVINKNEFSEIPNNPKLNTGGLPALKIIEDLNLNFGFLFLKFFDQTNLLVILQNLILLI